MSENNLQHPIEDSEECSIFVDGASLEIQSVESAIEALARDEALQADEARRLAGVRPAESPGD